MLCVNHSHASVPRSAEGRNPVTWVRNCSNVKSSTETPKTAKSLGSRFAFTKLKSAGISLRFVRSPAAPKSTITQAPAGLPVWSNSLAGFAVFAVAIGILCCSTSVTLPQTSGQHCRPPEFGFITLRGWEFASAIAKREASGSSSISGKLDYERDLNDLAKPLAGSRSGQAIGFSVVLTANVGYREIERSGQFPADPVQGIKPRAAAVVLATHLLDHYF